MRSLALLSLVALGCPGPATPHQLWLAQSGSEAMLRLADREPNPF